MKAFLRILRTYIYPACTLAIAIITFFQAVILFSEWETQPIGLGPLNFGQIMLFSFLFVLSSQLLKSEQPMAMRVLFHCTACTASFYLSFIVIGSNVKSGGGAMILIAAFLLLYFLVATPLLIVYSRKQRKKNEEKDYRSILVKNKR